MKISVAMASYNGADFILEQLDSIINQTRKVDEIIICDDGSSDNSIVDSDTSRNEVGNNSNNNSNNNGTTNNNSGNDDNKKTIDVIKGNSLDSLGTESD